MRKSKIEAAETRRKIVKTAAAEFCGRGIHATGLAKPAAAKARALVALSTMVGALTMSRVVTDNQLSDAILSQAKKHLTSA